jgi:hypothetical protein
MPDNYGNGGGYPSTTELLRRPLQRPAQVSDRGK